MKKIGPSAREIVSVHPPFNFADKRLTGFHDEPFIRGRFPSSLLRPKIKIAFADQLSRATYAHEFSHGSTRTNEPAFSILEINLVSCVLEQEIEKLLF